VHFLKKSIKGKFFKRFKLKGDIDKCFVVNNENGTNFLFCMTNACRNTNFSCSVVQGGSNMTGTDLCVNKPHCAAAVRP